MAQKAAASLSPLEMAYFAMGIFIVFNLQPSPVVAADRAASPSKIPLNSALNLQLNTANGQATSSSIFPLIFP